MFISAENKEKTSSIKAIPDVDTDDEEDEEDFVNLDEHMQKISLEADKITKNKWFQWGSEIHERASERLKKRKGVDINPYHAPELVKFLLKHLALLPLWSNIFRDDFNTGRVPATAASSENEFKRLKHDVFPDLPYRVDYFVHQHLEYLLGKMLLVSAPKTGKPPDKVTGTE